MSERIYLTTKFKEKDQVKALGARWDAQAGQWYVPDGLDLAPFGTWLPAGMIADAGSVAAPERSTTSRELETQVRCVTLSKLLGTVEAHVTNAFREGVWTTAEVLKASVHKGHYYLELSERSPNGEVLAQARAVIWARSAQALLAEFKRVTGADLDSGIKVLLRARPVFKSQYGFSLEVDGIDPSYTLGDLEARKMEIRDRLKREGLFDRNRALPAPWDYSTVLVIAPERAAGLGDFAKEAQRLQAYGICEFSYVHSRFQGEGAAAEVSTAIRTGLRTWSGVSLPDAVVIIRGGGSVNDLAWLNDYELARCVCECPVPVLTGIGHERDGTSLDEVAHRRFDTPSKVIAGIEDIVRARAREARALNDLIIGKAKATAASAARDARQMREQVEQLAKAVVIQARTDTESTLVEVRHRSISTIHKAGGRSRGLFDEVRAEAKSLIGSARYEVPDLLSSIATRAGSNIVKARQSVNTLVPLTVEHVMTSVRQFQKLTERAILLTVQSASGVRQTRRRLEAMLPSVLERAAFQLRLARVEGERTIQDTAERASRRLAIASERSSGLFREIAGQGPQKTLHRGFAVVRLTTGQTVTTVRALSEGAGIEIDLRDGTVTATADVVKSSIEKLGESH